jgi:hypothetical protein
LRPGRQGQRGWPRGLVLPLVFLLFLPGCGLIKYGKAQRIPVTSAPPGANLFLDGKMIGTLPLTLRLKRNKDHVLRIEKEGCNASIIEIVRARRPDSAAVIVNDVIGGILAGAASGALVAEGILKSASHDDHSTLFLGIVIGGIVTPFAFVSADERSGALFGLKPETVSVTLTKREGAPREEKIRLSAERLPQVR